MNRPTVLILYSELMGYTIACLRYLVEHHEIDLHVISWDQSKKISPYQAPSITSFVNKPKSDFASWHDIYQYAMTIAPTTIFVSGWIDKDYLKVTKACAKQGITIVSFVDNQWRGTLKQLVARLFLSSKLKQWYQYLWVSGQRQVEYAQQLRFPLSRIRTGFYAADVSLYGAVYANRQSMISATGYPKNITFVGRLVASKGIDILMQVFLENAERWKDWTLIIIGNGELETSLKNHAQNNQQIRFYSFMDPVNLSEIMLQTGIFCLPSRFEPWGVVVHEFAAAGIPVATSTAVGANTSFLEEGQNGYSFVHDNKKSLYDAIDKLISFSPEELIKMGDRSHVLAQLITQQTWASTFMEFLHLSQSKR